MANVADLDLLRSAIDRAGGVLEKRNSRLISGTVHRLVKAHFAVWTDTIMYVTCFMEES
jgi:hypothetical protein